MAAVGDDQRRLRHHLAVGEPWDDPRVGRHRPRVAAHAAVGGRDHPHRLLGQRLERGADQLVRRIALGARSDHHERLVSRRQLDVGMGELEAHRPGDVDVRRPAARVLELGEGRDDRQLVADLSVVAPDGREPGSALVASSAARTSRSRVFGSRAPTPGHIARQASPPRRARRQQPERIEGQARGVRGIRMRDQARPADARKLGRERRGEREQVADHDVRAPVAQHRQEVAGDLRQARGRLVRAAQSAKRMRSGAAANSSPRSPITSRQRSKVSTTTPCPRARSSCASAIAGNAWPVQPIAATMTWSRSVKVPGSWATRARGRAPPQPPHRAGDGHQQVGDEAGGAGGRAGAKHQRAPRGRGEGRRRGPAAAG